jgi:hypothetical protein
VVVPVVAVLLPVEERLPQECEPDVLVVVPVVPVEPVLPAVLVPPFHE